jgi:16S rRNA (uracil1498-N3)-methyltransferase
MKFFYCEQLTGPVFLNAEESYHCFKVLRLRNGERIMVTDGKGKAAEAEIVNSHPEKTELQIIKWLSLNTEPNYSLHMAISLLKNPDRLEWFAEKATELGVQEITPLLCSRTEKKSVNTQRLRKNVLSAMKQSMRCRLPVVHQPADFQTFIQSKKDGKERMLLCTQSAESSLHSLIKNQQHLIVMIGPEGDFDEEEIALAEAAGIQPVTLGTVRLRTETAGIYICAAAKIILSA